MKRVIVKNTCSLLDASLERSVIVFLLVTAVTVFSVNSWTLWSAWQHKLSHREKEARNLSVSLAKQAEDTFLQVDMTLNEAIRPLRQNGLVHATTPAFKAQLREQHSKLSQLQNLFIYDKHGNWIATSGSYARVSISNADRDYFVWHRTHNNTSVLISHVIRSRSTGKLVIPVSIRLNDNAGNFAGVALATIKLDYFQQFYSYFSLNKRDVLALILGDASVLYIRPFPDDIVNRKLSSSPLFKRNLKASDIGSATWRASLDNVERIFSYAQLKRFPLIVVAGFDRDAIKSEWISENLISLILNLALIVIIMGMGTFMLRQARASVKNQTELAMVKDELTSINQVLQSLALVDGLTGLANRRQFDAMLKINLEQSHYSGEPLSLIMVDIDFFKRYNDTYGHVAGDYCLQKVGEALKSIFHYNDEIVARYGGEEFAIILPSTNHSEAMIFAEQAIQAVRNAELIHGTSEIPGGLVTISAGCSTLIASGQPEDTELIKKLADNALYNAKRSGRNRAISINNNAF